MIEDTPFDLVNAVYRESAWAHVNLQTRLALGESFDYDIEYYKERWHLDDELMGVYP